MEKSAYTPEELGNSLLTRVGQGAVGGIGITALYHLLDQARRKKSRWTKQLPLSPLARPSWRRRPMTATR
jgi:hypothetical protein